MSIRSRGHVQALSLAVAVLAITWVSVVWLTGGFDVQVLGLKITSHDLVRPGVLAFVCTVGYLLAGGRLSRPFVQSLPVIGAVISVSQRVLRWRRLPLVTALLLATGVGAIALLYNSKVAGGSDSWGYLGFSEQWLSGELEIDVPFAREVPWSDAVRTFSPLGYRPADDGSARLVPTYSAGFPLMLAAAKAIGGEPGKYAVLPICGAILVLATFAIGRRLASPAAGVIAAALVATSPTVLHAATVMLSDLPTAAAWAAALCFVLGGTGRSALVAGLAAGIAVLTRPNHLPLAAVLALVYVDRARESSRRPAALRHLMLFALGAAVGIGGTAAVNAALFGSPFRSGYGQLSSYFSLANVLPNLWRYPGWIAKTQTPLVLLGFVALALPLRRLWPARGRPAEVLVLALFSAALLGLYLIYSVFDSWEYLRFVIALWPPMMVGAGAILALLLRFRWAALSAVTIASILALSIFQIRQDYERYVFTNWEYERRYINGALMTASHTVPNSVVLSMQHSGSVRYYAGRTTMRYDYMGADQIDAAVQWLTARGVHVYLLADDWELPFLDQQWRGTRTLQAVKSAPLAVYITFGRLYLFDISSPRAESDATDYVDATLPGISVPGPVPVPVLRFKAPSAAAGR